MIVCSCNVLNDTEVRSAIGEAAPHPRMSRIYASLGCEAKCGRCAHTIKSLLEEARQFVTPGSLAMKATSIMPAPVA